MNYASSLGRITSGGSLLAFIATAGAACYMVVNNVECCTTYMATCQDENDPPNYWTCKQSSNAAGWLVTAARGWVASDGCGNGRTNLTSGPPRGSCEMTYRECGPTPGSCIVQNPVSVECSDTSTTGDACPACP